MQDRKMTDFTLNKLKDEIQEIKTPPITNSNKKNFFDLSNYLGRIKEFLDNAE